MASDVLNFLTGGESGQAQQDLEQALQSIQAVPTPTIGSMQYQLQQMVQAGILSPEKAQFYLQNPSAFAKEVIPQLGTGTQEQVINEMMSAANAGGLTPTEQAQMQQILDTLNTTERGADQAVLQDAAARGTLTGGETLAAELEANQNAAKNANLEGGQTAAAAYQQMLNELTSAGSAGATLQGQENTQANTVASAIDAINKFNAAQEQGTENFNVQNENAAQAANVENAQQLEEKNVTAANEKAAQQAQLPQEVFQDALAKAEAEAGVQENKAGTATGQGEQLLNLEGGLASAATSPFSAPYINIVNPAGTPQTNAPASGANTAVQSASEGGVIHDYLAGGKVVADDPAERARIPGNSPKNDKIPAFLSEDEVVLPRTIAQNPQPDRVMDFLNRIRGKKPVQPAHPHDVKSVLDALEMRRAANG